MSLVLRTVVSMFFFVMVMSLFSSYEFPFGILRHSLSCTVGGQMVSAFSQEIDSHSHNLF